MEKITIQEVEVFLDELGQRCQIPCTFYFLGGGGLCLLGSPRPTLDLDYFVESTPDETQNLQVIIESLALEMGLEIEDVPLHEFIPLPEGASSRHHWVGQFGLLRVYVFDPYSMALSKLARGFETDLVDVLFLLNKKFIALDQLETYVQAALPRAWYFDIEPSDWIQYLAEIKRRL